MIHIHTSDLQPVTCVPNTFIDRHMKSANGDYVKVYLYLLRSLSSDNRDLSISSLADAMDFTEADVTRALRYWEKSDVLTLKYNSENHISDICLFMEDELAAKTEGAAVPADSAPVASAADTAPVSVVSSAVMADSAPAPVPAETSSEALSPARKAPEATKFPAPAELAAFRNEDETKELLYVAESYLARPLSPTDISTILYWHRDLALGSALIEHLMESCIASGHQSLNYMNKIAISWHEKGITTVSEAKSRAEVHSVAYYTVKNALGIGGRDLVETERDFITKWTEEYAFSLDIIKDACRRNIEQAGNPSFKYVDKILTDWHNAGVKHLSDVAALDEAHKSAKQPAAHKEGTKFGFEGRSKDYTDLETRLLRSTGE